MTRSRLTSWVVSALAVAVLFGGCGDEGSETTPDVPPWCLADVTLPDDAEAVQVVLDRFPDEIGGDARQLASSDRGFEVTYEEALEGMPSIQILSVEALERVSPGGDELTAFDLMELLGKTAEEPVDPGGVTGEIEETSMDPDSGLVWGTGFAIQDDVRAPSVLFADPDSKWVFQILASSVDKRAELVDVFCEATRR